jgi:hypothetical protein
LYSNGFNLGWHTKQSLLQPYEHKTLKQRAKNFFIESPFFVWYNTKKRQKMEQRKLTFKEKMGVFAALLMFCAIGMMMGGPVAGNETVTFSGAGLFAVGSAIGVWLILDSKKNEKNEDDEMFM